MSDVKPAELRELAASAEALAEAITAVHRRMGAAPDGATRRVGARLDEAIGATIEAGRELAATAEDLARVRARSDCPVEWGCCPAHGATLCFSEGRCWCTAPGCGRQWDYDRAALPCCEPVAFAVADRTGQRWEMCAGHAHNAEERLDGGATLTRLSGGGR